MDVLALMLVLFVGIPVGLGYFIPSVGVARATWLALGAILAFSQSQAEGLGGAWILIAALVGAALLLVQLGHYLRES